MPDFKLYKNIIIPVSILIFIFSGLAVLVSIVIPSQSEAANANLLANVLLVALGNLLNFGLTIYMASSIHKKEIEDLKLLERKEIRKHFAQQGADNIINVVSNQQDYNKLSSYETLQEVYSYLDANKRRGYFEAVRIFTTLSMLGDNVADDVYNALSYSCRMLNKGNEGDVEKSDGISKLINMIDVERKPTKMIKDRDNK